MFVDCRRMVCLTDVRCYLHHQHRIIRQTGNGMSPISPGSNSDVEVMVTESTAILYADPVVMNNAIAGFATSGLHRGYHQRLSPMRAKTDGEGGSGTGSSPKLR